MQPPPDRRLDASSTPPVLSPLPIDAHRDAIVRFVRDRRAVVVTAAPGAGKTTRVPPALVADGPVILLQPRRVAARAIAQRIATERCWRLGREVGWQVRFDRRFSSDTQLLVVTEGILTARLQEDPLLSEFRTIVIDEFHERSVHVDLAIALAKQAWRARTDLRIVVMSATIDAARVSSFLDDCPVVDVPGRLHPIDISYLPAVAAEEAIARAAPLALGATLCFLPGAADIRRVAERLRGSGVPVFPLHGGLSLDEQSAALAESAEPRVILATNIAETTLTVPDVRRVIDAGLQKVARYDAARGIDSLDTERVTQDAAEQRAGRAGRTAPGAVIRLWDPRDRLRPHREPEMRRVDLAPVVMDVIAWGGDPRSFEWFEPPPVAAVDAAFALLRRLRAVDAHDRLTPLGHDMRRLPLHPRLAGLLLAAGGASIAARACAVLSERHFVSPRHGSTSCDLLALVEDERHMPAQVLRVAQEIESRYVAVIGRPARTTISEEEFRRAVLAGYPDRVARRRVEGSDAFLMASGTGARLSRDSGVHNAEFIVATDVGEAGGLAAGSAPMRHASVPRTTEVALPVIRLATRIEKEWLEPTSSAVEHEFNADQGIVRAWRVDRYGEIPLQRVHVPVDAEVASGLLAAAYLDRGLTEADEQLARRLAFVRADVSIAALVERAAAGVTRLSDVHIASHLPAPVRHLLARDAPAELDLPSGRRAKLRYEADGRVVLAARLQWLFGLDRSPTLGPATVPVTFELLAPSGRPVQVTSDLESFWTRTYPALRPALRARYPKHQW